MRSGRQGRSSDSWRRRRKGIEHPKPRDQCEDCRTGERLDEQASPHCAGGRAGGIHGKRLFQSGHHAPAVRRRERQHQHEQSELGQQELPIGRRERCADPGHIDDNLTIDEARRGDDEDAGRAEL